MANGLMNLSNLLGQSSNTQSGGLLGGGVFSQPMSRGQRRSKLLTDAISGAGQNPYARLGASFGGLAGMGARAGAESLGILEAPAEVQRNEAIRQVQQEVRKRGLDPMANPAEFGEFVSGRFNELNQPELATRTRLQIRQMMPEQQELPAGFRNLALRAQAAGLKPETPEYAEFMRTGGRQPDAGTTVNVGPQGQDFGSPPKDTVFARNEDGTVATEEVEINGKTVRRPIAVPISGSKAAREEETAERERTARDRASATASSVAIREFGGVLEQLGYDPQTGEPSGESTVAGPRIRSQVGEGGILDFVFTGQETGDFARILQSVQDTISVNQLLQIKQQGSGLGQVPQSQLRTLSRLLGSLDPGLSDEALAKNLYDAQQIYKDILETSLRDQDDPTFRGMVRDISGTIEAGQTVSAGTPQAESFEGFSIERVE